MHIQRLKYLPILPCKKSSILVWLDGECLWTAIFKSCQRFSIGFRSGLWLGHSNTWICVDLNHSIVALAVCFGLLSCWKVKLCPSLKSFADSNRFSSKIVLYFPSSHQFNPVPAEKKASPQHDAATTMCHGGYGVVRVILWLKLDKTWKSSRGVNTFARHFIYMSFWLDNKQVRREIWVICGGGRDSHTRFPNLT